MKNKNRIKIRAYFKICALLIMLIPLSLQADLSGFIIEDTTFTIENSPYSVDGDLFITAGTTVKINPGVTFQFKANTDVMAGGDYSTKSEMIIYGTLICEGTADSMIIFKSYFGSNTAGEWGQVLTDLEGEIFIQYTEIKYATNGLNIYNSTPMEIRIENCVFQNISSQGIRITSSDISKSFVSGNTFTSVVSAIYSTRSQNYCSHNVITGGYNGIEVSSSSTLISNTLSSLSGYACKVGANSFVIDNDIQTISGAGIYLNGNTCSVINNSLINIDGGSSTGGVYAPNSSNNIYGNFINGGSNRGIYFYTGDYNQIVNNIIINKGGYGIRFNYGSDNTEINYNTIYSNGDDGINIYNGNNININNNIVTNNTGGIYSPGLPVTSDYDNVWNNGTNYSGFTPGEHSISVNPYFTNPDINDFTLQTGSPCLVMGENGGQMGAYGGFRANNNSPVFDYVDLNNASNNFYADESFDILWTASDADGDNVRIYLYWDTDTDTTNMTNIIHDLDNSGSYTWNTSRMNPGSYYIHAVAYDYKLGRGSAYSAGQVIISHDTNNESTPTNLTAYPSDQSILLNWTGLETGDIAHYVIYQSTVSGFFPATTDSIGETSGTALDISGLTNGTAYYYRVAARKTDGSLTGFTNEISATPQAVTLSVGSESSAPGSDVTIPISITDVSGLAVISYQFTVNFSSAFLVLNSVTTTDCITSDWSNLTVNIESASVVIWHSGSTPLTGAGNLVNLEFTVNSNATPGGSTEISLTDVLINEGTPEFNSFNGEYSVYPAFNISGTAQYYMGEHSLEGVTISLTGAESAIVNTTATGEYSLGDVQGGWSYEVSALDTGILSQAISAYDAALILRHIAQLDTLDDNQLIAADVSGDGTASSTDAANIGQWGVGLITDFPSGEAWYFTPEAIAIDPLTQDTSMINFIGIAYGDVSGNWDNTNRSSAPYDVDENRSIFIETPEEYFITLSEPVDTEINGEDFIVYDLNANTIKGMLAFTFKFQLEGGAPDDIEFILSEDFMNNLSFSNYHNNQFIITSAGVYPIDENNQSIGKILLNKSSSNEWGQLILSYAEVNEESATYDTQLAIQNGGSEIIENFKLHQNYPNPFNNSTVIKYDIPINTEISLHIFDVQGKLIKRLMSNRIVSSGRYDITWKGKNDDGKLVPSGVYVYRFISNEYSKTGKLLFVK